MTSKQWSTANAEVFWSERCPKLIMRYESDEEDNSSWLQDSQQARQVEEGEKAEFFQSHSFTDCRTDCFGKVQVQSVSDNLIFWITNSSWTFCNTCKLLTTERLLPNFSKRPTTKQCKNCKCKQKRYVIPLMSDIPDCLKGLKLKDLYILRPVDVHVGNVDRLQHGYKEKNDITRLSWNRYSVENKINALTNCEAKIRCQKAYDFLMDCNESSYKKFVDMRDDCAKNSERIHAFNFKQTEGIECALWPNLYPKRSWCESVIEG